MNILDAVHAGLAPLNEKASNTFGPCILVGNPGDGQANGRLHPVTVLWGLAVPISDARNFPMPDAKTYAARILTTFERAQGELVGKAVVLTDGTAGTVEQVWLDEFHGCRPIRLHRPDLRQSRRTSPY